MSPRLDLLVVVHPGSAYGSLNMRVGKPEGGALRDVIAAELRDWTGDIVIVDSFLSDEIDGYSPLGRAIDAAVTAGAHRIFACDNEGGLEDAGGMINDIAPVAGRKIRLTGIWATDDDSSGCVNSVAAQLRELGADVVISDTAIREIEEVDETFGPTP